MNVKEITVSWSGVIPTASYQNFRPGYSMTLELTNGDDVNGVFAQAEKFLKERFDLQVEQSKADYIEKMFEKFRFYKKDGKKYPSVTTILGWDKEFHIPDANLALYAARGTIVHKILEAYLKDDKWPLLDSLGIDNELALLKDNFLGLSWENCSYEEFMEKFREKIVVEKQECVVFNDEQVYAGRYDILGTYDGKRSIMDFKTGTYDMAQLAAYAICEENIEQLVVLPVGPTENKCGYMKPVICTDIEGEYKKFLVARNKFRKNFGV